MRTLFSRGSVDFYCLIVYNLYVTYRKILVQTIEDFLANCLRTKIYRLESCDIVLERQHNE